MNTRAHARSRGRTQTHKHICEHKLQTTHTQVHASTPKHMDTLTHKHTHTNHAPPHTRTHKHPCTYEHKHGQTDHADVQSHGHTGTHARTCAPDHMYRHTHTRTRKHTHTQAHAHTHTHTNVHQENVTRTHASTHARTNTQTHRHTPICRRKHINARENKLNTRTLIDLDRNERTHIRAYTPRDARTHSAFPRRPHHRRPCEARTRTAPS